MKKNFWKNKRVFITGHTGFKGSWLTLILNNLGAKIVGYSLDPISKPNLTITPFTHITNSTVLISMHKGTGIPI